MPKTKTTTSKLSSNSSSLRKIINRKLKRNKRGVFATSSAKATRSTNKRSGKVVKASPKSVNNSSTRRKTTSSSRFQSSRTKKREQRRTRAENILLFTDESVEIVKLSANSAYAQTFVPSGGNMTEAIHTPARVDGHVSIRASHNISPHVVDLKQRRILTALPLTDDVVKENFETKLYNFDSRFKAAKTNFITKESVKDARTFRRPSQGRLSRQGRLLSGKLSDWWEHIFQGFNRWGSARVDSYLSNLATKQGEGPQVIRVVPSRYEPVIFRLQPLRLSISPLTRSLIVFVMLAMVLVLPIKAYTFYSELKEQKASVLGVSTSVYGDLSAGLSAISQFDFSSAQHSFSAASEGLLGIKSMLDEYPSMLISLAEAVPAAGDKIKSGRAMVEAGNTLAQAGELMSQSLYSITANESLSPTEKLSMLRDDLMKVRLLFMETDQSFRDVDIASMPPEYQEELAKLQAWLPSLINILDRSSQLIDFSLILLGHNEPQKYLVIFQNNNELRPSGGFIGSLAEIDIRQGEVTGVRVPPGGVYDLQGDLKVLLASPKPLHLLNANWQLQDANWFFDFPTTAEKVLWFYEKSGGPTVDGLIAVNANILPKLLVLTGPIELPQYEVTLTADNIIRKLQIEVELNYDQEENQPKKIIRDLLPVILEKLQEMQVGNSTDLVKVLSDAFTTNDIQIYHSKSDVEDQIKEFGWAGEVKQVSGDYIALVDTNIGGGKTDSYIKQQVNLHTTINERGDITNELHIIRSHMGEWGDVFSGQTNTDYIRVYVPEGSTLTSATGFTQPDPAEYSSPREGYQEDEFLQSVESHPSLDERSGTRITQEFGKTVFANWVRVNPGETQEVTIVYKLPFRVSFKNTEEKNILVRGFDQLLGLVGMSINETKQVGIYTMLWQKQSGQMPSWLTHELSFPPGWQVTSSPSLQEKLAQQNNDIYWQTELKRDDFWGVIFIK